MSQILRKYGCVYSNICTSGVTKFCPTTYQPMHFQPMHLNRSHFKPATISYTQQFLRNFFHTMAGFLANQADHSLTIVWHCTSELLN